MKSMAFTVVLTLFKHGQHLTADGTHFASCLKSQMNFLVVDDNEVIRDETCRLILEEGHEAFGEPVSENSLVSLTERPVDAVLLEMNGSNDADLSLLDQIHRDHPSLPIVALSAKSTIRNAVDAMRRGSVDFVERPFQRQNFLSMVERLSRIRKLNARIEHLEEEVSAARSTKNATLVDFENPLMKETMDVLDRASSTPASILIFGESGTGKSVIARMVHERSHLADMPFVTVSCPSLSKELLESELFGHVKGSFTGAIKDHWGKVRAAEGGTLFLDEIGDLPMEIQPKLLRLLQEREYERLGENITRNTSVRVIAATNRNLKERLQQGLFREDLFYRLNVVTIEMPPLRKRPEDLLQLAPYYVALFTAECGKSLMLLSDEALLCLRHYSWPGNLRELRNTIERAVILTTTGRIKPKDLPLEMQLRSIATNGPDVEVGRMVSLERLEESHIRKILQQVPNIKEAAEVLGIDQATLYRKRRKFGI